MPTDRPIEIIEIDGPSCAWFELPLEYFVTANGEIEAEGMPGAVRLSQLYEYRNVWVDDLKQADAVIDQVRQRLKELGGGVIWWRRRYPSAGGRTMIRLTSSPPLPLPWWDRMAEQVGLTDG